MFLKVAVCEDEGMVCRRLAEELKRQFQNRGCETEIELFTDPERLAAAARMMEYQACFLDIDMPRMDGIDLAVLLKKFHEETQIIFISNRTERVFQSFAVSPLRFIRKDHFREEIGDAVTALLQRLASGKKIEIQQSGTSVYVDVKDIVYIESYRRVSMIHIGESTLETYHRIGDFEEQLGECGFIRIHKSYLVNYRFVRSISSDHIVLSGGESLPVSKYRLQEVKARCRRLLMKEQVL